MIALLAACSGTPTDTKTTAPPDATPVDGDTLVVAFPLDPGNVNPLVAPFSLSGMIADLVQPGLVRRVVDKDGLTYEPALAKDWQWGDGGTSLTYHLRDDVKWADGQPLDATDVQFTQELIADPLVASNWMNNAALIKAVEASDPRTVTYRFDVPRNPVLQQGYTIRGVVPKHTLVNADRKTFRGDPSGRAPLASGPYTVAEWAPNEKIVLEPNPAAPADWRSHLDRLVLRIIPEYQTQLIDLLDGDVDMVLDVLPDDVTQLRNDGRFQVVTTTADSMMYIGYNLADPRFADRRVRVALTEGLDRDKLARDMFSVGDEVHAQPCIGTIAPTLGAWFNPDVKPFPYDPAAAGALLDEAGWKDTDGDGIRDKDGKPLRFAMMVPTADPISRKASVRIQAAWKEIGAQVDLDVLEEARFADRARQKQYEAIMWGFGQNPKVDMTMEWTTNGQYNWFGYSNPDVDALVAKGVAAVDLPTSQAAFREAQAKVYDDQPATFLFWRDSFFAIDKRFHDTEWNTFQAFQHVERWWVPTAEQKYHRPAATPKAP